MFFIFPSLYSQIDESNTPCSERSHRNQGELEDCWSMEFLRKEIKSMKFEKFKGQIINVDKYAIKFEDKYLLFLDANKKPQEIFLKGIFYPQLLIGYDRVEKIKIDTSLTDDQKFFKKLSQRSDTLKISSFEELKFLKSQPQVKRFRFWVYHPGTMNPQVFFIELINQGANAQTKMEDFIEGAKLTFLKGAWTII